MLLKRLEGVRRGGGTHDGLERYKKRLVLSCYRFRPVLAGMTYACQTDRLLSSNCDEVVCTGWLLTKVVVNSDCFQPVG